MDWLWVVLAVAVAAATAAATPGVLRWLAAPAASGPEKTDADAPAEDDPVDFGALATPRFAALVGLAALGAGLVAFSGLPPAAWLAWTALVGPGALAAGTDAATTWIPYPISLAMAVLAGAGVIVWAAVAANPLILAAAAAGALLTGGFFHVFHKLTRGGIGYGDVRLMTVAGAVCAPVSLQLALWAPLLGTLLGAVWGVLRLLRRGRGEYALGPSLWLGVFLALLAVRVIA